MWLVSRSCAAPTRRQPLSLLPRGSTVLAPSADRRLRTPGTLPALILFRSRGDYGTVTTTEASAPDAPGFSERHGSLGGKSPRGIGSGRVPASPCLGVLRRRSAAPFLLRVQPGGRSQARCCTCAALSAVGDRRAAVDDHWAGLPVTQGRPWPAEDVWSEARAAPAMCTGAGKRAERFPAASSRPAIRPVRTTPGASAATHRSSKRIPSRRGSERSESKSGARFPARGSRPQTDKAGAASAAAQPPGTTRDLREETR